MAPSSPAPALLEAEDSALNRASVRRLDDAGASAGRYVFTGADYNPLFIADFPTAEASRLSIWARTRGTSIQLKTVDAEGRRTERAWSWGKTADWRWVHSAPTTASSSASVS